MRRIKINTKNTRFFAVCPERTDIFPENDAIQIHDSDKQIVYLEGVRWFVRKDTDL